MTLSGSFLMKMVFGIGTFMLLSFFGGQLGLPQLWIVIILIVNFSVAAAFLTVWSRFAGQVQVHSIVNWLAVSFFVAGLAAVFFIVIHNTVARVATLEGALIINFLLLFPLTLAFRKLGDARRGRYIRIKE